MLQKLQYIQLFNILYVSTKKKHKNEHFEKLKIENLGLHIKLLSVTQDLI